MFGIVLGNGVQVFNMLGYTGMAYEIDDTTRNFHGLISFFIRTFFFVFLGLLVTIADPLNIAIGVIIVIGLLAVRLAAVRIVVGKVEEIKELDMKLMTVMMPRGLAAAVLAYLPMAAMPGEPIFRAFGDIVFTVILGTAIVATIGVIWVKRQCAEDEKCEVDAAAEPSKDIKKPEVIETKEEVEQEVRKIEKKKRRRKTKKVS
jgi:cell volume regulation protein A